MSFMNDGQCQPGQIEGIVISMNEGNPLTNNKIIEQISKN